MVIQLIWTQHNFAHNRQKTLITYNNIWLVNHIVIYNLCRIPNSFFYYHYFFDWVNKTKVINIFIDTDIFVTPTTAPLVLFGFHFFLSETIQHLKRFTITLTLRLFDTINTKWAFEESSWTFRVQKDDSHLARYLPVTLILEIFFF